MLNFFGVSASLEVVEVNKETTGYEGGAHWAVYSELKAKVEALGLKDEHCDYPVLNYEGRCIARCDHNLRHRYEFDCTGNRRESMSSVDRRLKLERELH